jgi:hypothetical protein
MRAKGMPFDSVRHENTTNPEAIKSYFLNANDPHAGVYPLLGLGTKLAQ